MIKINISSLINSLSFTISDELISASYKGISKDIEDELNEYIELIQYYRQKGFYEDLSGYINFYGNKIAITIDNVYDELDKILFFFRDKKKLYIDKFDYCRITFENEELIEEFKDLKTLSSIYRKLLKYNSFKVVSSNKISSSFLEINKKDIISIEYKTSDFTVEFKNIKEIRIIENIISNHLKLIENVKKRNFKRISDKRQGTNETKTLKNRKRNGE